MKGGVLVVAAMPLLRKASFPPAFHFSLSPFYLTFFFPFCPFWCQILLCLVWAMGFSVPCFKICHPHLGTSFMPVPGMEPLPVGPLRASLALAAQVLGPCQELCV